MATAPSYTEEAYRAAVKWGIDPDIFLRQIGQESGFNPNAVSPAGAVGIAQFMPATAQALGVDPTDPVASLDGAARHMRYLLDKYGSYELALAAYNAGEGNVDQYGGVPPFQETQQYVSTILGGGGGVTSSGGIPNPFADSGGGGSLPGSGDVVYNGSGQAFVWSTTAQKYVREPSLDNASKSADFTSSYELAQLEATKRGQDISIRGQDLDQQYRNATLARDAADAATAKDQWLQEQQVRIAQLGQEQERIDIARQSADRDYQIQLANLAYLEDKQAFDESMSIRTETRETQAQIFNQQAVVADFEMRKVDAEQRAKEVNAQLQQEVALFNAGKAADVSMFNIDQQTKTAMFNSEGAMNAQMFNAEMGFAVDQANKQEERLRQERLQRLATDIGTLAADPIDRGKYAATVLANSGWGEMDAALLGADNRTSDSLMPLEALLRQREDVMGQDANPYSFDPVTFQPISAGQASFTPAKASQISGPDYSGVKMPSPNTTPFDASSVQKSSGATPQMKTAQAKANYVQSGQTTMPAASTGQNSLISGATGQPLTAEERAQIPDFVLEELVRTGIIPAAAEGGIMDGAYLGDEKGPEAHIPFGNGLRMVIPANLTQAMMGDGASIQPVDMAPSRNIFGNIGMPVNGMPDWEALRSRWMEQYGGMRNGIDQWADNLPPAVKAMIEKYRNGARPPAMTNPAGPEPDMAMYPQPSAGRGAEPSRASRPAAQPKQARAAASQQGSRVVSGPYIGNPDDSFHVPIPGTNMTVIQPRKGRSADGMPAMATGGLFAEGSLFEGLLGGDSDRQRAQDFLNEALRRGRAGTPYSGRLPTAVFASSPGFDQTNAELLASLNAMAGREPAESFLARARMLTPAAWGEQAVGRTR